MNINNNQLNNQIKDYDNGRYTGQIINGLREGKGIMYFNKEPFKGDRYEGDFRNGKMEGKGIYYSNNGNVAKPQFARPSVAAVPQSAMPTVRQISTIPLQTAVVQQINTPRPQVPVVSQMPAQQVLVQSIRPQVSTYRPINTIQSMVRPPVQPVQQMIPNPQPLAQNMAVMRPG